MAQPHMREAALERLLQTRVRLAGGIAFKMAPTHVGLPDRLVVLPGGRLYMVELKTEVGHLSPAQVELHKRLAGIGVDVAVLYGPDQVIDWCQARMRDYDSKARRKRGPRTAKPASSTNPPPPAA